MKWEEIISDPEFKFVTWPGLIILVLFYVGAMAGFFLLLPNEWKEDTIVLWSILLAPIGLIYFTWLYKRRVYPKGQKDCKNIIVAITTENRKQKVRIKKDFAQELKNQLRSYNLNRSYKILVLSNALSKRTINRIKSLFDSNNSKVKTHKKKRAFKEMSERLNASFYLYGDLVLRNAQNETYYLEVDALLLHSPAAKVIRRNLSDEFRALWKREIAFLEQDELNGFKDNARHIFFTATYMLGLATLVNNDFENSLKIWINLEKYVDQRSDLSKYKRRLKDLKGISLFLISRYYQFRGETDKFIIARESYLNIFPNEYDKHLIKAIDAIEKREDPNLALQHIYRAKKLSKGDGTWRYSQFYLLIFKGENREALKVLEKILQNSFKGESDTIKQVIIFNKKQLRKNQNHIQSYFIIGAILYKKLGQPIPAYTYLEKFVKETEGLRDWEILRKRACHYLNEIDQIISVNDK